MEIVKKLNGNKLEIAVSGRLDTNTAPSLDEAVNADLNGVTELCLDFEKLEYVSSAGLRVLLSAQKKMNAASGKMVIRHVCDEILEVFDITGFSDILTVEK